MKGIFSAVAYMHDKGIVHRDLKPGKDFENILTWATDNILVEDANDLTSVKIVDFGLTAKYQHIKQMDAHCGTLIYMAPEIANA